jgi:hypothetical protein
MPGTVSFLLVSIVGDPDRWATRLHGPESPPSGGRELKRTVYVGPARAVQEEPVDPDRDHGWRRWWL